MNGLQREQLPDALVEHRATSLPVKAKTLEPVKVGAGQTALTAWTTLPHDHIVGETFAEVRKQRKALYWNIPTAFLDRLVHWRRGVKGEGGIKQLEKKLMPQLRSKKGSVSEARGRRKAFKNSSS
jgi:hypothetical protein